MQAALRTRLVGAAGVQTLVGDKVHWAIVPAKTALPYIRLQTISDPREPTLAGLSAARTTRVRADCMATKYGTARAIAEAVVAEMEQPAALDGIRFGKSRSLGPRDLGEDVPGTGYVHRLSLDLLIEHARS